MDSTQVCSRCGVEKPMTDFYFRQPKQTYEKRCRACASRWHREYMPDYHAGVRRKRKRSLAELFWAHVNKNGPEVIPGSPCWLWSGAVDANGYGKGMYAGKHYGAHRVAYELVTGVELKENQLLHHCDVRRCVNPDHLRIGTQQENMMDMLEKGRGLTGFRNPNARIRDMETVQQVRALHASGRSILGLGRDFGVCETTIRRIILGWPEKRRGELGPR